MSDVDTDREVWDEAARIAFSVQEVARVLFRQRSLEAHYATLEARNARLVDVLADAHDALGELMASPFVQIDWPRLADYLGNEAWCGLGERVGAALALARGPAGAPEGGS
jgi:hypothetical protein